MRVFDAIGIGAADAGVILVYVDPAVSADAGGINNVINKGGAADGNVIKINTLREGQRGLTIRK